MAGNLPIELLAQNDHVLAITRQQGLFQISRIPNPRLRHEVESGTMHDSGPVSLTVRSEKDRRAEDALERGNQPPVLGTALLYAERIEHFGCAVERDSGGSLPDSQGGQEDWNQPVLPPRQSIARVPGDL